MTINLKDWALKYIRSGYGVIPLRAKTKDTPLVKWKQYQIQKPTEADVEAWWSRWPDANIAMPTGKVSNSVVFDSDGPEAEAFIQDSGGVGEGAQSITARGRQYFCEHPGSEVRPDVNGKLFLDIRGDGSYVVLPPSVHPTGHVYQWASGLSLFDVGLAGLRPWQQVYIRKHCQRNHSAPTNQKGWELPLLEGVSRGMRNETAAKLAGFYLAKGLKPVEVFYILLGWNSQNTPPLNAGEIEQVVESIEKLHNQNHTGDQKLEQRKIAVSIG